MMSLPFCKALILLVLSELFMTAFPRMISAQMLPAPSISQVKSQNSEPILSDSQPSASQLSDVQPTDWAYQALQSLMERYRCIAGYPSQSFRGGRSLTRHEFAVGLKACLDQMETDKALHDDLKTVQRLQQVFAAELSVLRGRVDGLEAKTSTLETEQFSTTTKLSGDAIFQIADIYGKEVDRDNNTVFQSRVRLTLDTSFTGKDRLRIRLQSGNFQTFTQPGNEARFGYATNTNNALQLGVLNYQFPVGDRTTVVLFANGDSFEELTFFNPINPFDVVGGRGAISRFAALPSIYRTANTSAGAGINVNLTKNLSFAAGYLAGESASSMPGSGLFGGDYGVIGRLLAKDLFNVSIFLLPISIPIQG
jgi:hypothetical protein